MSIVLTTSDLSQIAPSASKKNIEYYTPLINGVLQKYQIDSVPRVCHFLAQVLHESGSLNYKEEIATGDAYENRSDLGNIYPGDGRKYKGRGLIQLTGRSNYKKYKDEISDNVIDYPTVVASKYSADVAGWFWDKRNLNKFADKEDFVKITKKINGGTIGIDDRSNFLQRARQVLSKYDKDYIPPKNDNLNNNNNEPPKSKGDYVSTDNYNYNDRGIKGKPVALTNFFGPTIKLNPININMSGFSEDEKGYFVKGLGLLPFVWYNSYQISYQDITYFTLFHDGILPNIKMTFRDTLNIIKSDGYPLDDTKIVIFLNSRSKSLKSIYMQFKITSFSDNGNNIYSLTGIIDVSSLYVKKYKAFQDKNSFDCLQEVAKDLGLGFNSNISSTNDKMTWISPGVKYNQFIDDVILNSYLSDDSFLIGYIDYFYNINYIDIESELRRDVSNDNMVDTSGIEQYTISDPTSKEEDRIIPLQLTTDSSLKNTNAFIKSYKITNDSTFISLDKGYSTKVKFYDFNKKDLLIFDVDSITSDGDKSIILKGAPADEKFFKENYNSIWTGKIDVDNVHTNYNYAIVQNRRNLDDLVKISCELTLGNPNFNFYKFQKVFISFINSTVTASSREIQLKRLTGHWIITDISYIYSNGVLKQILSGIKRELSMSDDEIKSDSSNDNNSNSKVNEDNNQINTNPDPVGMTNFVSGTQSSAGVTQSTPNENTNTKSDDTIISNSYLLNNFIFDIRYDGTKLKGKFGISGDGYDKLSKDLNVKLSVLNNSNVLDIGSFKLGGIKSKKPGSGEFISKKDDWKKNLNMIADDKRRVVFNIVIEGYDKYIFKIVKCISAFDCPELGISSNDIISIEDWNEISENPCKVCYPNGYSSGRIVLNGQICPMEGF